MNLVAVFDARAELMPDAAAIVEGSRDTATSWAQLAQTSHAIAAELRTRGLAPGDPVLVLIPMSARLYATLIAIWRLGAKAVIVDPSAGLAHVARCCELVPPRALIGVRAALALRWLSPALRRIPLALAADRLAAATAAADATDPAADAATGPDTPALVTFTSGSTGLPKAAVRTHGFLGAQYEVLARHLELEPGQIDLATLPVFVLANLGAGVTSVIPDANLRRVGAINPVPVVAQIERLGIDRAGASPAFLARIAEFCDRESITLEGLRRVFTGGAPVFPPLLDSLHRIAPNAAVHALYGSTEAEPIASFELSGLADDDRQRMRDGGGLFAGKPVAEIALRIIRAEWGTSLAPMTAEQFDAMRCAADEPGEIVVSGAHVLPGYLNGRGDRETKFDVADARWHRTGDAGRLDSERRLWLLGRAGARVADARGVVYPFAVESALAGLPGVARTAFVGRGEERLLVVEPQPGAHVDADSIAASVPWAQIDRVVEIARIPVDKRHNAKIDYPALERLLDRVR